MTQVKSRVIAKIIQVIAVNGQVIAEIIQVIAANGQVIAEIIQVTAANGQVTPAKTGVVEQTSGPGEKKNIFHAAEPP